jgi:hypothetical protein
MHYDFTAISDAEVHAFSFRPPEEVLRRLAALLLDLARRQQEKYRGVEVDPVAALREAELALAWGVGRTPGRSNATVSR